MINALSVDVEEYYHVSAFESIIRESSWSSHESRVAASLEIILDLLDRSKTRATFFVLGWLAEQYPDLVRRIHARGHEIASHGYAHKLIYKHSAEHFRTDLIRSKKTLEDIIGERVIGYRAPSYSIIQESLWALDILIEEEFLYDSSIFPIHHDRYGIPRTPRFVYEIKRNGGTIMEFPLSTVRLFGINFPIAGGGYLRLFPYPFVRWGINRINHKEGKPAIIYFHPWELDPDQPRQPVGLLTRVRHYKNLGSMKKKIQHLLSGFAFAPIREVLQASGLNGPENKGS